MTTCEFVDYYEILEASPRATTATIERLFRYHARQHHPDASGSGDTVAFTKAVEAFETLRDPAKRAEYDVRYDREKNAQLEIVAGANAAGDDSVARYRILSILYAKRRQEMHRPGIGIGTLETLVKMPVELLDFHMWYLREKGWVGREESGQISITAAGVEQVEAMNHQTVVNQLRIDHRPQRPNSTPRRERVTCS
ncbi:J domain-containing protein [Roseimaritima ulvae]|uniref:Curved DNA-binding protein n=1 Tax=Roseimaritima ulvae TaxID=980254 RepID=A0A5B9QK38_9BACT|nr:DnaJ domain-containing protein [Roseimaritima ulvae]QEG38092.1 Curved DNA-binding protein [Roseimaritima ulvae]